MPRRVASQSSDFGQIERNNRIIQKTIQMKELAISNLFLRIEYNMYKIIRIEIIIKTILFMFGLSFPNVFYKDNYTGIKLSYHIFYWFNNSRMH